ncbi:MAG TPA: hypothetical protein VL261_02035 [Nitrospira sp.]|jgi:hypothetical protein|nr:hypothetical protein [Nitrospira sp.]
MNDRPGIKSVVYATVCMLITGASCVGPPVVKPTCAISWDQSADYWRVAEYRLTVWRVSEQQTSDRSTHVVKAPSTRVSCRDVGATKSGRWQATVRACLTDGTCSEESKPMSFQVAEK